MRTLARRDSGETGDSNADLNRTHRQNGTDWDGTTNGLGIGTLTGTGTDTVSGTVTGTETGTLTDTGTGTGTETLPKMGTEAGTAIGTVKGTEIGPRIGIQIGIVNGTVMGTVMLTVTGTQVGTLTEVVADVGTKSSPGTGVGLDTTGSISGTKTPSTALDSGRGLETDTQGWTQTYTNPQTRILKEAQDPEQTLKDHLEEKQGKTQNWTEEQV